ncbi:hypothetical protein [Aureibacter tunicatorum]|uniref:Uncharacterized protein n=1 Tax=Aureibacter tunicatorum TaxID=866807 RepID=A0AAE3XR37_9BACT|nr:hypothetical protein [Aureibacter tunicatorum]MDR6240375.1 hypothetical protein [Aureibacter tunicatorum]BDD05744.1 hypothetical protein AUTU_32270 [Aureibacter tunicatorum]
MKHIFTFKGPVKVVFLWALFASIFAVNQLHGQGSRKLTYKDIYDNPYDINNFYLKLQPLYAEVFLTNFTAGYGGEIEYFWKNKVDFMASVRTAYAQQTDMVKDLAAKNNKVDSNVKPFLYAEAGFNIHLIDGLEKGKAKMVLHRRNYLKSVKWKSRVPDYVEVPADVRQVIGLHLGGMYYNTGIRLDQVLTKQNLVLGPVQQEGAPEIVLDGNSSAFANMAASGFYAGVQLSWIKNVIMKPSRNYDMLVDDLIFDLFIDLIVMPSIQIDPIFYKGVEMDLEPIERNKIGFRVGVAGKFNRKFSWGYGGEIGYRPGVSQLGFYTQLKVFVPVFGSKPKQKIEAVKEE